MGRTTATVDFILVLAATVDDRLTTFIPIVG